MIVQYKLEEHDFLQHQLYVASKTKRVINQRRNTWILLSVSFLLFSFANYSGNKVLFYAMLAFSIITVLFFPLYQKTQYKKHYRNFIIDNYKLRFGKDASITFTEDAIETTDSSANSTFQLNSLEEIIETGDHFFIQIKTGGHLIIPKSAIENNADFRAVIKSIVEKYTIKEVVDLNWKWK